MIIIMLGAPGSGKGTVGGLLGKMLNIIHISSGEIFRSYIRKHDDLGGKIASYINKGDLVPDDLVIKLVEKRLREKDAEGGVILDGYPRTKEQAAELDRMLAEAGKKADIAVNLVISDEEIIDRIINRRTCPNPDCREIYNLKFKPPKVENICDKCGETLITRDDDNLETVQERLKNYHEISESLIKYYARKDVLYSVKTNTHSNKTAVDTAEEIKRYLSDNHQI
jgi:adenylate kinase